MDIDVKKIKKEHPGEDLKIGQGLEETRGYFPESADVPKHNGLNVNNDPKHLREKENGKKR